MIGTGSTDSPAGHAASKGSVGAADVARSYLESAADVARSYLESFAHLDPDAIAAHVAPDFVNDHASALGSGCVGRDEYRSRLPGFLAAFAGLRYDIESVIADGADVAVEYRMTATSDDRPIDIRGVMMMTIRDGLIDRRTDYWDALTFLRQTDATPGE